MRNRIESKTILSELARFSHQFQPQHIERILACAIAGFFAAKMITENHSTNFHPTGRSKPDVNQSNGFFLCATFRTCDAGYRNREVGLRSLAATASHLAS